MPFSLNLYQISVVGVVGSENRRGGKSGIYRTQIKKKKRVSMCASSCQFMLSYFLALELLLRDQQTRERTESSKVELFNNLSLNTSTSCFSSVSSLTANT